MCDCREGRNGKESGNCLHSDHIINDQMIYFTRASLGQECKGIQLLVTEKDCKLVIQKLDLDDYYLKPYAAVHKLGINFTELSGICPEGYRFIRLKDLAEITGCAGILKLLLPLIFIFELEELSAWETQDLLALQARIILLCQPETCFRVRIEIYENFPDRIEVTS